jgi:hypothetical protein
MQKINRIASLGLYNKRDLEIINKKRNLSDVP